MSPETPIFQLLIEGFWVCFCFFYWLMLFICFVWFTYKHFEYCSFWIYIQFSSVTQSCPTLCDPMYRSTPGLPVHHQLPESTQTHVHCVSDAIQPSHPLSSPSPPALKLSWHQGLFKWVSSPYQVAHSWSEINENVIPVSNLIFKQNQDCLLMI